jgi:NAD(P)H-flavin reductase
VRGPFGTSWPVNAARGRDVIIVAGGVGLAPVRPIIYRVLRNRSEYGRLIILYGTRRPGDLLFRKELALWRRQPDTQVLTTVDSGGQEWRGHVGVVTTLFRYAQFSPNRSVAMVCGPEIMMRFAARELEAQGVATSDIYLSMERNMKCAVGFCGHCQWGPHFICKDGPVFHYDRIRPLLERHEL